MMVQRWWRAVCHTHECALVIQQKFKGSFWSSPLEVWEVFSYMYTLHFMLCYLFICLIILFNYYFNYYHANFTCISIYVSLLPFFLLFYFLMHSIWSIKNHQSWTIGFHLVVFMCNHMLMTDHINVCKLFEIDSWHWKQRVFMTVHCYKNACLQSCQPIYVYDI